MAHSLAKCVTAEGVELQDQLDFLIEHHCDVAQGYYFSKPMNADDAYHKYAVITNSMDDGAH